ncbi:MAG: hypothetical protein Q4C06_07555 [Bacillota bacterium]|nr:hypothetical protein [Bacillota bacterium]
MFTKPKNGWTEIHIGDFEGLGSYIQDVPVEVMEASLAALKKAEPLKLHFDEEGSAFTLNADEKTVIVADGYYGPETYEEAISKKELILEICRDMEEYFSDWAAFSEEYAYFEDEEAEEKQAFYEERETVLRSLLEELKAVLSE